MVCMTCDCTGFFRRWPLLCVALTVVVLGAVVVVVVVVVVGRAVVGLDVMIGACGVTAYK